ncbi:MAG: DUF1570 domain-containing protein [Planctomycetota bacterium]
MRAQAGLDLREYKTKNYTIHSDCDPAVVEQAARHMEGVNAEYSRRMRSFPVKNRNPVNVYLLNGRQRYLELLASKGINGAGSGGMFFISGSEQALVVYFSEQEGYQRLWDVMEHEGFHQFARQRLGFNLPTWLNEGIAEYFERGDVHQGEFRTGYADPDEVEYLRRQVREDRMIPLETLLTLDGRVWNAAVAAGGAFDNYLQSWATVQFFVHAEDGRYQPYFLEFIRQIARGVDTQDAFRQAFKTDNLGLVESRIHKYLERDLRQGWPSR